MRVCSRFGLRCEAGGWRISRLCRRGRLRVAPLNRLGPLNLEGPRFVEILTPQHELIVALDGQRQREAKATILLDAAALAGDYAAWCGEARCYLAARREAEAGDSDGLARYGLEGIQPYLGDASRLGGPGLGRLGLAGLRLSWFNLSCLNLSCLNLFLLHPSLLYGRLLGEARGCEGEQRTDENHNFATHGSAAHRLAKYRFAPYRR